MSELPRGLGFLTALRKPLTAGGVDFEQFALIVSAKFKLAARSKSGIGVSYRKKKADAPDHGLRNTFLLNLLIGVVIGVTLFLPLPLMTQLTAFYTTLFVMFFLQMLSGYSSLILDPRDRRIFAVRGVADRTLNAARLAVVVFFLAVTLVALAVPSLVVLTLQHGPLVLVGAALGAVMLAVFAFVLSLFLYLLVLRFFDGERLRNILNVVQIGLIVLMYAASQLPNLVGVDTMAKIDLAMPTRLLWWYVPAAPVWFAGPALLFDGVFKPVSLVLTGLAVGVTAALVAAYFTHAAQFEQSLEKLEQSSNQNRKHSWWFTTTRRLLTTRGAEATYFTLGWRMMQYERDFKLRVYPQLAYGFMIPVILGAGLLRGANHLAILHFLPYLGIGLVIALPTAIVNLSFSHQPEAMGIFRTVPFATHGLLLRGVITALFAKLILPFELLWLVVFVPFTGVHALSAGVLTVAMTWMFALLFGRMIVGRTLPFSSEFTAQKGATNGIVGVGAVLVGMIIMMAIVVAGGLLFTVWFDLGLAVVFALIGWLLWRAYPQGIRYDLLLRG
ncbi:ABC transporter permease [Lacticaseibacillus parakribbianus]|uniref:ABC transporter permease n=1 Tax=Lacticaseibacillus parakribbianus TaxID=2970927 RepID=UPI0021CB229B|nr:ABC transporter permease [Lacticaseibacillus parakribbianus]